MNRFVIIVAGGAGLRMKTDIPKQFLLMNDKPILMHTLEKFDLIENKILVLPKNQIEYWQKLCFQHNFKQKHSIVEGGKTRFHSVNNGLNTINEKDGIVGVHDGVRPYLSKELIKKLYKKAELNDSAIPFTFPKESIREVNEKGNFSVDRSNYRFIQTPQCFDLRKLKAAYRTEFSTAFTDDASVYENSGNLINLVEGEYSNIKITTQEDLV